MSRGGAVTFVLKRYSLQLTGQEIPQLVADFKSGKNVPLNKVHPGGGHAGRRAYTLRGIRVGGHTCGVPVLCSRSYLWPGVDCTLALGSSR